MIKSVNLKKIKEGLFNEIDNFRFMIRCNDQPAVIRALLFLYGYIECVYNSRIIVIPWRDDMVRLIDCYVYHLTRDNLDEADAVIEKIRDFLNRTL